MNYPKDSLELFLSFAKKHDLGDDIDEWPEELQDEFVELADKMAKNYESQMLSQENKPADKKYPEDFYTFTMTVDSLEGSKEVEVDVRKMSIEELSDLCVQLPHYYRYYVDRLVDSL